MGKQSRLTAGAVIVALLSGQGVLNAATVYPENGAVLVNYGEGFVRIKEGVQARPGTQVLAKPGGSAVISYDGVCDVRVDPGEVKLVEEASPCAGGGSLKDGPVAAENSPNLAPLIAGGALAATIVGVTANQDGGDKPASP